MDNQLVNYFSAFKILLEIKDILTDEKIKNTYLSSKIYKQHLTSPDIERCHYVTDWIERQLTLAYQVFSHSKVTEVFNNLGVTLHKPTSTSEKLLQFENFVAEKCLVEHLRSDFHGLDDAGIYNSVQLATSMITACESALGDSLSTQELEMINKIMNF